MGCDIHIFVEKWNNEKSEWILVRFDDKNLSFIPVSDKDLHHKDGEDEDVGEDVYFDRLNYCDVDIGRSYVFFAYLADVRNRFMNRAGYFNSLFPNRGLPPDISIHVYNIMKGLHSTTYIEKTDLHKICQKFYPYSGLIPAYEATHNLKINACYTPERFMNLITLMKKYPDETRLIIGFDS